jgi:hypothetical protein
MLHGAEREHLHAIGPGQSSSNSWGGQFSSQAIDIHEGHAYAPAAWCVPAQRPRSYMDGRSHSNTLM